MNAGAFAVLTSLATLVCLASSHAQAERADRQQAVQLEADKVTVNDKQKLHRYEGRVILIQGSLQIRTETMHVSQDKDGFQQGTAIGGDKGLATFRQKREARPDFVEGEAERIVHDSRGEKTEFFGRARVKSGLDEVNGQYIIFDGKTENYSVSGRLPGSAPVPGQRVRAVIQPRANDETTPTPMAAPASGKTPISKEDSKK